MVTDKFQPGSTETNGGAQTNASGERFFIAYRQLIERTEAAMAANDQSLQVLAAALSIKESQNAIQQNQKIG